MSQALTLKQVSKTFEQLVNQKTELENKIENHDYGSEQHDLVNESIQGIKSRLLEIQKGYAKASRPIKKRLLNNLLKQLILTPEGLHIKVHLAHGFEEPIASFNSNIINLKKYMAKEPVLEVSNSVSNLSVSGSDINKVGESWRIRTSDLFLRRELLYPAELRTHILIGMIKLSKTLLNVKRF